MNKTREDEPIVGIGVGEKDAVLEKLDIIIEAQEQQQDTLEEISERLTELELPYNSLNGTY